MQKGLSPLLFLGYCILNQGLFLKPATAQITPDGTTNTRVDRNGSDFTIEQGDRAGSNLFNSFGKFSRRYYAKVGRGHQTARRGNNAFSRYLGKHRSLKLGLF